MARFESSGPKTTSFDFILESPVRLVPRGAVIDASQFSREDAVDVTTDGIQSSGATSLTVDALGGPIPSGTFLRFAAGEYAYTTADAAEGDTSITVEALPAEIADGETATYEGTGEKWLPAGTPVGRTYTERDNGDGFGPADQNDDEIFLVRWDIADLTKQNECALIQHGEAIAEDVLTSNLSIASGVLTQLRADYEMHNRSTV